MNVLKKSKLTVGLFTAPALIIFTFFGLLPLVPPIIYSFFEYKNLELGNFIGIQNYIKVFSDPAVKTALINNLKLLFIQFLIGVPLSFFGAIFITCQGPKVRNFFKSASFLPSVLSVSAICAMWYMMLQPRWGPVYGILNTLGLGEWFQPWLSMPESSYTVICLTVVWQYIGYNMVLFYSGIKAIPENYFEAARIDGASLFQQIRHLTIPLMQESVKFVFIMMITGTMAMMANVQLMTQGSSLGEVNYTAVYYIYHQAFSKLDFGFAYALTVVYAALVFGIVLLVNRFLARNRLEYT